MLHFGNHQTLGYKIRRQKRATTATELKGRLCVMLLLYLKRQYATVGRTLHIHILPRGTVSTFYIANQYSKTSTHTEY